MELLRLTRLPRLLKLRVTQLLRLPKQLTVNIRILQIIYS